MKSDDEWIEVEIDEKWRMVLCQDFGQLKLQNL